MRISDWSSDVCSSDLRGLCRGPLPGGMTVLSNFDVIVLGAGAAGLMAAIEAGRRGRRVLLLEMSARPAGTTTISGGGRCNLTTLHRPTANLDLKRVVQGKRVAGRVNVGGRRIIKKQ